MSLITIDALTMAFGGQDVLTGVTAELPKGARAGVVGPNGAGKSTLLRLLAGLDQPTGGRISRARDARVVYVAQEPEVDPVASVYGDALKVFAELREIERQLTEAARALSTAEGAGVERTRGEYDRLHHAFEARGGYAYESSTRRTLSGLGLPEPYWSRRAAGLSGGERARLALAKALLQEPDVLLLDEPTNHLDMAALAWLEEFLVGWRGTVMVISHDRYFLDRVIDRVWELRDGHVDVYPGNYSHFAHQREERDLRQQELHERQQAEIARTEEFIRRYRNSQKSRQARGRQKQLDRVERIADVRGRATVALDINSALRSGRVVLRLDRLEVEHPGRRGETLIRAPLNVEIERGDRIALVGPNGSGKTTLLRTITDEIAPRRGRAERGEGVQVAFFRQGAEDLHADDDVMTSFLEPRNRPLAEARDLLARFLFRGEEVFKRVGDLSGGERSRLALARLFGCGANFLLLDEPTNHLDLPSREALEEVLPTFPGAILFVSHDRRFIDAVATHIWSVEGGELTSFRGNWTAFSNRVRSAGEPEPARGATASIHANLDAAARANGTAKDGAVPAPLDGRAVQLGAGRPATRDERRQAARVRDLEREVSEAEAALTTLQTRLEDAAAARDMTGITDLGRAVVAAEERLQTLIAAWEEAALAAGA